MASGQDGGSKRMSRYLSIVRGEKSELSELRPESEEDTSLTSLNSQEKKPARYLALLAENRAQDTEAAPVEETEAPFEPDESDVWPEPEIIIVPGALCLICNYRAAACTRTCPRWCLQCQQKQEEILAVIRQAKAANKPKPALRVTANRNRVKRY
jgi:hypothetical protein